jgi:hypothetical protein
LPIPFFRNSLFGDQKQKKNRIPEDFSFFLCFPEEFITGTWFWRVPRNSGFWTPSQEFFAGIPAGQEFLYLVRIPPDSSGFLQDSCSRQIYGTTNEGFLLSIFLT